MTILNICREKYQISAYKSNEHIVINIYCSSNANHSLFLEDLFGFINNNIGDNETIFLCGDFNISFLEEKNHVVIKKLIENKFSQIVTKPTHNKGHLLDQIYIRNSHCKLQVVHHSMEWFDHDALHVISHKSPTVDVQSA